MNKIAKLPSMEAKIGTIKLMLPSFNLRKLEDDYEHMKNMIYGDRPSFKEVMSVIKKIEVEFNES